MPESYPWHEPVLTAIKQRWQQDALPSAIGLFCAEGWGGQALLTAATSLLLQLPKDKDLSLIHI